MQTTDTVPAIYSEREFAGRYDGPAPAKLTGEPDALKGCAAGRGVESLTQSGGARRDAPGSSD